MPDALALLFDPANAAAAARAQVPTWLIAFFPIAGILFTFLQWYWALLLARMLRKMLRADAKQSKSA